MQVVDQPASRLESPDFWKVNMKRLKSVDIFRTARLTSGILWILRQNERREQKVPFFGWLVPSVNMRGFSKRFYYDFPPYGIVPLAKASKEGKELRQQVPGRGFYWWIQEGGRGIISKKDAKERKRTPGTKMEKANQSREMRNDVLHEKDLPTCKIWDAQALLLIWSDP